MKTKQNWLRKARRDADLTQAYVANTLGVTQSTVSNWENGIGEPDEKQIKRLATMYGLKPKDLQREVRL